MRSALPTRTWLLSAAAIGLTCTCMLLGSRSENQVARAEEPTPVRIRDITFDDVKFEMKKEDPFERTMLTPKIEKLAGTKIRVRGYMRPSSLQSGITKFILVRDNMECCFGP